MAQQIDSDLVNHAKNYAFNCLESGLSEPVRRYFLLLFDAAKKEAREDTILYQKSREKEGSGDGPYKTLVYFQWKCEEIPKYSKWKLEKILTSFVRENQELEIIAPLVWAILLANSLIISSFGARKEANSSDIKIPSKIEFIHELLIVCGRSYYNDPEGALRLEGKTSDHDIVQRSLQRTISQLIPFEELVNSIRKKNRFKDVKRKPEASDFAEDMIEKAERLGVSGIMDEVRQNTDNNPAVDAPLDPYENSRERFQSGGHSLEAPLDPWEPSDNVQNSFDSRAEWDDMGEPEFEQESDEEREDGGVSLVDDGMGFNT